MIPHLTMSDKSIDEQVVQQEFISEMDSGVNIDHHRRIINNKKNNTFSHTNDINNVSGQIKGPDNNTTKSDSPSDLTQTKPSFTQGKI